MTHPTHMPAVFLDETRRRAPAAIHALVDDLRSRFGDSLLGVLFYGSCRRDVDHYEVLIDLYVIVDALRPHSSALAAVLGWLLPPYVCYLEVPSEGRVARSKYALMSLDRLQHGIERRFHPYFWARFAQPTSIVWALDDATRSALERILEAAPRRLLNELPDPRRESDPLAPWRDAFRRTYLTELRVERGDRADQLVDSYSDYYLALGQAIPLPSPRGRRLRAVRWGLRIVQGKLISLARLFKGFYTFEGGLDYLAWKLERHTGRQVEVPARVRKWPLIFAWPMLWRLYREGVLR
ncbi:MAG: hypothetical protein P8Y95_00990 [Gammaproteobacteria bacterium]